MKWMLAVALVGCMPLPQPGPSAHELFAERWVGRHEDDVLTEFGRPTDVLDLSDGNHVNSYKTERAYSSSSQVSSVNQFSGAAVARSGASTVLCERRFEISKASQLVVKAVIAGSDCDYGR